MKLRTRTIDQPQVIYEERKTTGACFPFSPKGEMRRLPLVKGDCVEVTTGKYQNLQGIVTRLTTHQAYIVLDVDDNAPIVHLVDQFKLKIISYSHKQYGYHSELQYVQDKLDDLQQEFDDIDDQEHQFHQTKRAEGERLNALLDQDADMACHVRCIAKYFVQHNFTSVAAVAHILENPVEYFQALQQDPTMVPFMSSDSFEVHTHHSHTHTSNDNPTKQEPMEM